MEFIDRQRIMCAVVLEAKNLRLRLLTENNREVNISANRLSHKGNTRLDLSQGRDKLVDALKKLAMRRKALVGDIDIRDLWEILNSEQEWIDLATMTQFCFPDTPTFDHESAVIRAFFNDRQYFKFNTDRFLPNTREQVERIKAQERAEERKNRIIETGAVWLKGVLTGKIRTVSESLSALPEILQTFYLFGKESPHHELAKAILEKAGQKNEGVVFQAMIKLGLWNENENIELLRLQVPQDFSEEIMTAASETAASRKPLAVESQRRDLRDLPLMTIDGHATLDFDDAISLEIENEQYVIGVHIADVGHYIHKGDGIDEEARIRASSIYMPDRKISMIPPALAEDLCSLKAGEERPAVSIMARVRPDARIADFEIFPSIVRVTDQLTYSDVNLMAEEDRTIGTLFDIAKKFQQNRLDNGAVEISLPEVNVWIEDDGTLSISRTNRQSPGRLLVAELMIMANWLMARYLFDRSMPAIYRSQPEPRERLFKNSEGTLYQNWMQRKLLSRFALRPEPEHHSGLGLDVYVTASSPIRKYFDLATQRQVRATFGLEKPYGREEIQQIIQTLEQPMATVSRAQFQRNRYWLLKYLEGRIGLKEEAIVLGKRKGNYTVLLTEYLIESIMPVSMGIELKPESLVQVTVQHVDARKDLLSVFLG